MQPVEANLDIPAHITLIPIILSLHCHCQHCNTSTNLPLPLQRTFIALVAQSFINLHRDCH